MLNRTLPSLATLALASAAATTLTLLGACGGDPDGLTAVKFAAPSSMSASADGRDAAAVVPLQFDDEGNPVQAIPAPQAAEPVDRRVQARHAQEAQARQLAQAIGVPPLEVEVECCDGQAVERAVGQVRGLQAAHDLPLGVPVLLRSTDWRLATAAADRLARGGMTNVWLVAP